MPQSAGFGSQNLSDESLAGKPWALNPPLSSAARNRRLARGILSGVVTKGVTFLLTLLTVPMTLQYLGPERYGIWVTMFSMLAWLGMVDLGIANGLTPALSAAFGKKQNDIAREYVATAFWALIAIALVAGAVMTSVWGLINWGLAFNLSNQDLQQEVSWAMAFAVGIFLANLPLSISQRILLAHQEGLRANVWQLAAGLAGATGIFWVTLGEGPLLHLVLGYAGTQLLVAFACGLWLFGRFRPELRPFIRPNYAEAKLVLSMGGMFFANQVATLLMFQKDNILITHYLGPAEATPYSVTWQIFFYLNIVNILISPYLGASFGEAYARGDVVWMRKAFRRYMLSTCVVAIPAVGLLGWFYRPILAAWVGPEIVPTPGTVFWMAAWSLLLAILGPIVSLLVGVGRLERYTVCNMLAALASLLLSIWLVSVVGVAGVVMASVLCFTVLVLLPSFYEVRNVFRDRLVSSTALVP